MTLGIWNEAQPKIRKSQPLACTVEKRCHPGKRSAQPGPILRIRSSGQAGGLRETKFRFDPIVNATLQIDLKN